MSEIPPVKKTVVMPAAVWGRIVDYRFTGRINTENEAINRLIEAGLGVVNDCEDCRKRPRVRGYRVCIECWGDRPAAAVLDAKGT